MQLDGEQWPKIKRAMGHVMAKTHVGIVCWETRQQVATGC